MDRFLITLTVAPAMRRAIDAWQRGIGFVTNRRLPLHVTLVPPFQADLTPADETQLTSLPIDISLRIRRWATLRRDETVILVLEPEQEPLRQLVHRLVETMPLLRPHIPADQRFHVTIKRFSEAAWMRWKPRLAAETVPPSLRVTVNRLTVYRFDARTERWIPSATPALQDNL